MKKQSTDILIIGGGVHGAGLAYHLSRAKVGTVTVLEKNALASGPTSKSGAMIRPIFTERTYIELVMESISMFSHWNDLVGGHCGFVQNGFLRITDTLDANSTGGDLQLMNELGVQYELLEAGRLKEFAGMGEFTGEEQGLWLPGSGYADPALTTVTLAAAAKREGAMIEEGIEVTALLVEGGRVRGAALRDGEIAAGTVIVCAGPWTTRLLDPIGVPLPIEAHRTPTCMFLRPPDLPQGGPILSDGVNLVYLRDMGERLMRIALFGWTPDPAEPDDYDETVSRDLLENLRAALRKRYEPMRHSAFMGGFSALYDMTPDAHPIIGPMREIDGLWCNCGWSGNGFASAPAVGRSIAAMITGNGEGIDLSMFGWPRPPGVTSRPDVIPVK
jgi:glycine/D-amino acid oxidase-like deaminating enzyme